MGGEACVGAEAFDPQVVNSQEHALHMTALNSTPLDLQGLSFSFILTEEMTLSES